MIHDPLTRRELTKLRPLPQRQDSLNDQLDDLRVIAKQFGMYDADDWLAELIRQRRSYAARIGA
jgi:hypothetical protein